MKRKINSILIAISIICSCLCFTADTFANDEKTTKYQTEIEFLKELGIVGKSFSGDYKITRGEMAKIIISALHSDVDFNNTDGEVMFSDVSKDDAFYSYIKACSDLKIINGNPQLKFRPDDIATVTEMLTVTINALNYTPLANANGGYPTGYYAVAKSSGISKGIDFKEEECSVRTAYKIIYNALFADIVALKEISKDGEKIEIDSTKNLLSERYNIYEYNAVLTDDGITSLYSKSSEDGENIFLDVVNSDKVIKAHAKPYSMIGYLGHKLRIYVKYDKDSDRNEVVYFEDHKDNKVVTIKSSDIVKIDDSGILYQEDKDKLDSKKINFSLISPKLIFNGCTVSDKKIKDFLSEDALFTCVDYDNNGKCDIISILSFNYKNQNNNFAARDIVVDSVTGKDDSKFISNKFDSSDSLDLKSDKYAYAFTGYSAVKTLDELKNGMILSVSEAPEKIDGKTFYFLSVSTETVNTKIISTGEPKTIYTKEDEYELSSSILSGKPTYIKSLTFDKAVLYLDVTGKVAYVEAVKKAAKNYAYLMKISVKEDAEKYVKIKYFNYDGKVETALLNSRVKIDGIEYNDADLAFNALKARSSDAKKIAGDDGICRPFVYEKKSDGLIINIDTDTPNLSGTELSELYKNQTPIKYTKEEEIEGKSLMAGWRNPGTAKLLGSNKSVAGKFYINMDTVIFAVPDIDTYGIEENYNISVQEPLIAATTKFDYNYIKACERNTGDEEYRLINSSQLYAGWSYDIQGYDIDPDTHIAKMAVVRGVYENGLAQINMFSPEMSVFIKKTNAYDVERGKDVTKLYYQQEDELKSAIIDTEDCFFPYRYLINGTTSADILTSYGEVKPLKPGDVIRVMADESGRITHLERIAALDNNKSLYACTSLPVNARFRYTNGNTYFTESGAPFDTWLYPRTIDENCFIIANISKINSGIATLILPKEYRNKRDTIDIDNSETYGELYMSLTGVKATVTTIKEDGTVTVKSGTLDDIITTEKDKENPSLVVISQTGFVARQYMIFNGLENLK